MYTAVPVVVFYLSVYTHFPLSTNIILNFSIHFVTTALTVISIYFSEFVTINPYPTAFPYGNGMVLHFYQQQESSTTKTVHKVINKGLKAYV